MDEVKRSLVNKINKLLAQFPAVVLIGARQVGKSTLLKQVLPEAKFFDLEDESDFSLAENDPQVIFSDYQKPIIFDEAQLSKNLFKALRVEIDKDKSNGQFLLSGSSSPELLNNISESLAGRIAIVEIPTLDFSECHSSSPSNLSSSIHSLDLVKNLKTKITMEQLFESCLYGGYPRPFLEKSDIDFFDAWFNNYIKTYIERDIRSLFPTLKLDSFKKFIHMLAFSSGQIINYSDFAKSLDASQPTAKKYFEIAHGTFIWRTQNSYTKNSKKIVTKMPKGHFRDSGLLCHLLNIHTTEDLKNHPHFGRIWESFIIEQIIKMMGLTYNKFDLYYYRTKGQAEIDLILEGRFGLIPIEIKSGIKTEARQIQTLKKFVSENNCPYAIVVNRAQDIKMLAENVVQLPAIFI